ncbi:MAG: MerR family transcriptional regulator [Gammaproteobacteria bacterium]
MATFGIRELVREFGVTARSIRHYEEIGLLSPSRRGQTRVYSAADRTRLKLILRGKRLGLSLEESRAIIGMYDPATGSRAQLERLLGRLREQRASLLARRHELDAMLAELEEAESGCLAALAPPPAATAGSGRTRNRR